MGPETKGCKAASHPDKGTTSDHAQGVLHWALKSSTSSEWSRLGTALCSGGIAGATHHVLGLDARGLLGKICERVGSKGVAVAAAPRCCCEWLDRRKGPDVDKGHIQF